MSVGFRFLLIVLIGFCSLCVYHMREGQLSIWLGFSPPPQVQRLPGEDSPSSVIDYDTMIETTIKPATLPNGVRPRVPRRPTPRWNRPSIEAGELAEAPEDTRRFSANTPHAPETGDGVPAPALAAGRTGGSLNLINPGPAVVEPPPLPGDIPPEPEQRPTGPEEPAQPRPPVQPEVAFTIYVVKDGDKLWNLAEKYLGAGHLCEKIIEMNTEQLGGNPDHLRPGMKLKIPAKKRP